MLRSVLVVEDDRDTREMLASFLELEGYHVETATNGRQALDRLETGDRVCLILLDLMMPVMDGWEFRKRQTQIPALASIPVIVVSAAGRDRIEQVSATEFLSKPVDMEQLLGRVAHYCENC
jgi:CheY-like chemotaxis protein